ncbi:hypothetical protein ACC741_37585, partial [Rhizobium johnstonii]|uniref:hypothetical protein n=1 Tax=Rhizobium johnstonii TaxID=3019933 RepID=UPI003F955062
NSPNGGISLIQLRFFFDAGVTPQNPAMREQSRKNKPAFRTVGGHITLKPAHVNEDFQALPPASA